MPTYSKTQIRAAMQALDANITKSSNRTLSDPGLWEWKLRVMVQDVIDALSDPSGEKPADTSNRILRQMNRDLIDENHRLRQEVESGEKPESPASATTSAGNEYAVRQAAVLHVLRRLGPRLGHKFIPDYGDFTARSTCSAALDKNASTG